MHNPASQNTWMQLSSRVYRLLLLAYPQRFREEYAMHMVQVFLDCCRAALQRGGSAGILVLWASTLLDFIASLLEQYSHLEVEMNREKFIRMSGGALILGTLAFGLMVFGSALKENLWSGVSWAMLAGSSITLITLGIAGLYARYGGKVGVLGRSSLLFSTLSGVASLVSIMGVFLVEDGPWWFVWLLIIIPLFLLGLVVQVDRRFGPAAA